MNDQTNRFDAVEFSVVRKGYDRDEVDACLRSVAQTQLAFEQQMAEYRERVQRAESQLQRADDGSEISVETIARTLVIAQHTAEGVLAEAKGEAARLTAEARDAARAIAEECEAHVSRLRAEAELDRSKIVSGAADEAKTAATEERNRLAGEVADLAELRDLLQGDVKLLEDHLSEQRSALLESVSELRDLAERPERFRMQAPPATSGAQVPEPLVTCPDADPADSCIAAPDAAAGPDAEVMHAGGSDGAASGPVAVSSLPASRAAEPDGPALAASASDPPSEDAPEALDPKTDGGLFEVEEFGAEGPMAAAEPLSAATSGALSEPFGLGNPEDSDAVNVGPGGPAILRTAEQVDGLGARAGAAASASPEAKEHRAPDPEPPPPSLQEAPRLPPMVLTAPEIGGGVAADPGFNLEATAPFTVIEVPEELPAGGHGASAPVGSGEAPPTHAADSFLEQLREAVSTPGSEPVDDPLTAFFDQDDDSRDRSWFGRRR